MCSHTTLVCSARRARLLVFHSIVLNRINLEFSTSTKTPPKQIKQWQVKKKKQQRQNLKDSFNGSRHFNTQATLFLTFLFPVYIYNMAFFFMWDVFVWIQVNKVELRGCNIKYCGQNKGFGVFSSNDVSDGNQNLFINLYIHICALYVLVVDWKRWLFL